MLAPDQITLPLLPSDGATAVDRSGRAVTATPRNFANASAPTQALPVNNIEFYNQSLDHYFVTALAARWRALAASWAWPRITRPSIKPSSPGWKPPRSTTPKR